MNYYELSGYELEAVRNFDQTQLILWLRDHGDITEELHGAELEIDQELGNPVTGARIAYD